MSKEQTKAQLDRCLTALAEARGDVPGREEVAAIVQSVLGSLQGDVSAFDIKLYEEVSALATYIKEARDEIAALRPKDISEEHIPMATDELDAIVAATEEATSTILDAAEQIEEIAKTLDPEVAAKLDAIVTSVYEASNFQDITGQRITKVVKTLSHIEERIASMAAALGVDTGAGRAAKKSGKGNPQYEAKELLEGPQLPENANSQDEIDALFAD